ncbi:DUF4245 domain-containing protein [Pseudonocardia sp.]|uniref:DUF4245 domain-containing protein n=1 Tax=Pseudonocardia sp. TaxID=60912 RepID=UPI003D0CED23
MTFDPTPPHEPRRPPPRSALGPRQLVGAILVLLPVVLLLGGLSRCSFAPGGPEIDPSAGPAVDAPALLRDAARLAPFAVRIPAVPPGWRSNAVDRATVAGGPGTAVRAGYVTGAGRYLELVQSDAPEEALVRDVAGTVPPPTGVVDVGGTRWVVYGGDEALWVADVAGVRLLVTGSAGEDEFRTLAEATLAGETLPAGTPPPR